MRYYRITALAVVATAAILFGLASTARAADPACEPLQAIAEQLDRANVPEDKVTTSKDVAFTVAYLGALGLALPEGSKPIGIVFVDFGDRVVFGIVEDALCIKFASNVSPEKHKAAVEAATKGV